MQETVLHFDVPFPPSLPSRCHTSVLSGTRLFVKGLGSSRVRLSLRSAFGKGGAAAARPLLRTWRLRWCYLRERRVEAVLRGDDGGDGDRDRGGGGQDCPFKYCMRVYQRIDEYDFSTIVSLTSMSKRCR